MNLSNVLRLFAGASKLPAILVLCVIASSDARAYPLDGVERTGIQRLTGYVNSQANPERKRRHLPAGALLGTADVGLHLTGAGRDWDLNEHEKDPALQAALASIFATREASYGVVVVDFSDPENIAWAGVREDTSQYPGSVGKTVTMIGFLDALARAVPEPAARAKLLRERRVTGGDWVRGDSHAVPHFEAKSGTNRHAPIATSDTFRLSEWIDHMMSPSANAAGALVWKEAMLLRQFGKAYPPTAEQEAAWFSETPKADLARHSVAVSADPLAAAGLDTEKLRQGSFWTRHGKNVVPGISSTGSPRELARLLVRIEQGRIVDPWSSREAKRYLYLTKKRYRYAYPSELHDAAIYFKSGSLYSCAEEEGFRCGKYAGNKKNYMNSIAIVESPARPKKGERQLRYAVALMSNVLRKNSAWDHARLAAAIEEAVRTRQSVRVNDKAKGDAIRDSGASH